MFPSISVTHLKPSRYKKHILKIEHNTNQNTQNLETFRERHVVRSTCSSWFEVSGGGENTSFATSKLGKVVSIKKIKVFVSILDLGFIFCSSANLLCETLNLYFKWSYLLVEAIARLAL